MKLLFAIPLLWLFAGCTPVPGTAVPVAPTRVVTTLVMATAVPSPTPTASMTTTPILSPVPTWTATPLPTVTPAQEVTLPTPSPTPTLTAACQQPEDWPPDVLWSDCTHRKVSPDGRWVATFWGLSDLCWSGLGIFNVTTSELKAIDNPLGAHWFEFMPNNRLLFGIGTCSNDEVYLYYPETEDVRWLAGGSSHPGPQWNVANTAFVMNVGGWGWAYANFWAYDMAADQIFFSTNDTIGLAYWTPDGLSVIYQYVSLEYTENGSDLMLGPGAIHLVEMESGEERPLLSDPQYHYYLCLTGECQWDGDWLLIQRIPYTPRVFVGDGSEEYNSQAEINARNCVEYARSCPERVEKLWLNWRTGETRPYE